jgi:hypothetical protein
MKVSRVDLGRDTRYFLMQRRFSSTLMMRGMVQKENLS